MPVEEQHMTNIRQFLFVCGVGIALCATTTGLMAQDAQGGRRQRQGNGQGGGRQRQGNFDPAQFQQRMVERYKERLEITDESEWKAIQPLISKVLEARMVVGTRGRGMFGRGGRPGGDANQRDQAQAQRGGSDPAVEQLQKVIDSKAPAAEVKQALARYQAYRKEKQTELEKAQAALRSVLTARQEAIATISGLL